MKRNEIKDVEVLKTSQIHASSASSRAIISYPRTCASPPVRVHGYTTTRDMLLSLRWPFSDGAN